MRKVQSLAKAPFPLPDVVTKVVPAPTEGWDAISPLASMDPKRAPILDNWVPRPGWVELRAGFTPWTWVGNNNAVETLMVRRAPTGERMFAAVTTSIYEVSALGQADPVVTGLSSARWYYINFTPGGGTTVIQLCNGIDTLRQFDGTSWTAPAITGLPGGLNTTDITNIYAQKRRIWYILGDGAGHGSTVVAFMPTDAITGPIAGTQDFGALWTRGGYLVAMSDWTVDGGNGPQDMAAFMSSQGQVSIFAGTDPTSSLNWSLVGTFDLSPPVSAKCMTKVGSDVAVITQQGVVPLSQALPFDPSSDRSVAITARIQNAMALYTQMSGNNFGWQIISYPNQQLAVINVPITTNTQQVQLVMNTLTGAWCRFTGWNANCFEVFNNDLYFGGNDGTVNLAYDGGLDLNTPISGDMQCAFNYFDDPGRIKRMTIVQPLMVASGSITPTLSVDEDFAVSSSAAPVSILVGGALWDTAVWDTDIWAAGNVVVKNWLSAQAIGHALAVHMGVNVTTQSASAGTIGAFDIGLFDSGQFDSAVTTLAPALQVNAFNTVIELGAFI
jgi:hypothetical protein